MRRGTRSVRARARTEKVAHGVNIAIIARKIDIFLFLSGILTDENHTQNQHISFFEWNLWQLKIHAKSVTIDVVKEMFDGGVY